MQSVNMSVCMSGIELLYLPYMNASVKTTTTGGEN